MSFLGVTEYLYPIDKLPDDVRIAWKEGKLRRIGSNAVGKPIAVFEDGSLRELDPDHLTRIKDGNGKNAIVNGTH